MKHTCLITVAAAAMAISTMAGCRKKTETLPPQAEPAGRVEVTPQEQAEKLSQRVEAFSREAARLPGRTDAENRRLMAERLGDLAEILPMLESSDPPGAFRQQVRIITGAQSTLRNAAAEQPVEPTVGLALRATENALSGIQSRTFYAHDEVAAALQPLRARVNELDTARGPLHQLVAAQAMREIGTVLYRMTSVVHARADVEQPSDQPAATAPATP